MKADFRRITSIAASAFIMAAYLFTLCACNESLPENVYGKGIEISGRITLNGENLAGVSVLSENGDELTATNEYGIFTASGLDYGASIFFVKEGFSFSPSEYKATANVYDLNVKASEIPPDEPDNPDEPEEPDEPDIPDEPEIPETVLDAPSDLYLSHFGDSLCISFTADKKTEILVMNFVFGTRTLTFTVDANGGESETDGITLTVHKTENADGAVAFIAAVDALTQNCGTEFSLTVTAKAADAESAVSRTVLFQTAVAAAISEIKIVGGILSWTAEGENAESFFFLVNVNGVTLARTEATEFDFSTLSYDIPDGAEVTVAAVLDGRIAAVSSAVIFGGTARPDAEIFL